ncbi:metal-dependent transcriptional regulator [Kocuria sp. M4R2S49]|uniref:metal-dependent transcriptional regulator n=1 Tax=Kocuria rhizosphaericola TaxID=3376284 RepID=UPI00379132AB
MSNVALSESMQNYLKAVWGLQEWSDDPVTATEIARRVGVRVSTVSDALRKLSGLGLVEHARYGRVTLTETGRAEAVAVVRRHRLLETFLVQALGYSWDEVHEEAEVLEHAVSEKLVERVDAFLGHPRRDPHGDPIPAADGTVTHPVASRLTSVQAGARVRVERISDAVPARLQYFAEHGVVVGAELEVAEAEPFSEAVAVRVAGTERALTLGEATTDAVWVSPV